MAVRLSTSVTPDTFKSSVVDKLLTNVVFWTLAVILLPKINVSVALAVLLHPPPINVLSPLAVLFTPPIVAERQPDAILQSPPAANVDSLVADNV